MALELSDVVIRVKELDSEQRVQVILYELYVKEGVPPLSYDDFDDEFKRRLAESGLGDKVDTIAELIGDQLLPGTRHEQQPDEFTRAFLAEAGWRAPTAAPEFENVDGFRRYRPTGVMYLPDEKTEVFAHTGYPGQKVYYDRENRLYQNGKPYPPMDDLDGFLRDTLTDKVYLSDRTTEVFAHDSYPGQGVYYDRKDNFYQHGRPYTPAAATQATATTPTTVNLATDSGVVELLTGESHYDELAQAVQDRELVIDYSEDEDVSSFEASLFANVD